MVISNHLLEISCYTILLLIIVIAIKMILKDKLSPTLHFLIWFLPIARLCIPFTLDSNVRLIVIPQETIGTLQAYGQLQLQRNSHPTWADYFLIVWLIGMLLLSIRMLVNMAKMKRIIICNGVQSSSAMEEILSTCRKELSVRKNIKLLMLPNITTPALTIELWPKLIMPTDIHDYLSEQQLELVLKHELMHYKRRDHLIVMLLRIIEIVYWFNPLVWVMSRCFALDMESACDSMVVRNLDNQSKKHYALSIVQLSSRTRRLEYMLGLVFGNNERNVEKRIRRVFQTRKRKTGVILATGAMSVALSIACFTTIFQPVMKYEKITKNEMVDLAYNTAWQGEPVDFYNKTRSYYINSGSDRILLTTKTSENNTSDADTLNYTASDIYTIDSNTSHTNALNYTDSDIYTIDSNTSHTDALNYIDSDIYTTTSKTSQTDASNYTASDIHTTTSNASQTDASDYIDSNLYTSEFTNSDTNPTTTPDSNIYTADFSASDTNSSDTTLPYTETSGQPYTVSTVVTKIMQ